MANKKTVKIPKIKAEIVRLVDYENSKIKAIANVCIADAFVVNGLKVVDSKNGLFVMMPQEKYTKDGQKQYADQFYAVSSEVRKALNDKVIEAYENKLAETENENMDEQSEERTLEQTM